jgi:hypothetical protein
MRYHHKKKISLKGPEYAEELEKKRIRIRERYSLPTIGQLPPGMLPNLLVAPDHATASLEETIEEPEDRPSVNQSQLAHFVDQAMRNDNNDYFNEFDINNY